MTALDARPFVQVRTCHPRRGRPGFRRREALRLLWSWFGVGVSPAPLDPATLFGRWPLLRGIGSGVGRTSFGLVFRRATVRPGHR